MRVIVTGGEAERREEFADALADLSNVPVIGFDEIAAGPRQFIDKSWITQGGILTPKQQTLISYANGLIILAHETDEADLKEYSESARYRHAAERSERKSWRIAHRDGLEITRIAPGLAGRREYLGRLAAHIR